jgi:hypothetical protein
MAMDVALLPIYNQPSFQYFVTLNNVGCTLLFNYNARSGYYHLTVTISDGTVVMGGRKVVPKFEIFTSEMYEKGPKGSFYLTPKEDGIVESTDTIMFWADNYLLSFAS